MMIIEKLRAATAAEHAALEASRIMQPIRTGNISLDQYTLLLQKFYGFIHPLEILLDRLPWEQHLPDYHERRKSDLILKDLEAIHVPPPDVLCHDLPLIATTAQGLGVLYVLEGSTLGGKIISRILETALNLSAQQGNSYFSGYGIHTGSRWKEFIRMLVSYDAAYGNGDQIVNSASETFIKFKHWLT